MQHRSTNDILLDLTDLFRKLYELEQSIEKVLEGVEPTLACTALTTKLIISLGRLPDKDVDNQVSIIIKTLQKHQSSRFEKVHKLLERKEVEKAKASPAVAGAAEPIFGATVNRWTNALIHFIPAGMLIAAVGRWPYGYYMLLRIFVAAAALLLAGLIYQRMKSFTSWFALFLIVVIVFNPIVPLHLTRGVWSILNLQRVPIIMVHSQNV